jgi:hypothetical protein
MTYKVFLFERDHWLYCENVSFEKGVWKGDVVNGRWYMVYDSSANVLKSYKSKEEHRLDWLPVTEMNIKMIWACDPFKALFDYNTVIENAREQYLSGEEPNFEVKRLKKQRVKRDYEDEIAF